MALADIYRLVNTGISETFSVFPINNSAILRDSDDFLTSKVHLVLSETRLYVQQVGGQFALWFYSISQGLLESILKKSRFPSPLPPNK